MSTGYFSSLRLWLSPVAPKKSDQEKGLEQGRQLEAKVSCCLHRHFQDHFRGREVQGGSRGTGSAEPAQRSLEYSIATMVWPPWAVTKTKETRRKDVCHAVACLLYRQLPKILHVRLESKPLDAHQSFFFSVAEMQQQLRAFDEYIG